jgi:hypothetical protein
MSKHPTWKEIRDDFLADPEVKQAYDDMAYEPVVRDRAAERARCEDEIPGYREARNV